jgi:hypothetical protein
MNKFDVRMSWMAQNITQNFADMLNQSLEQSSILLITVTAVVGIGSFVIKTISEPYLRQLKREKKTRKAVKKYSYALLRSAYTLRKAIDNHLLNHHTPIDVNIHQEKLYDFGCFFAWCKILEMESFLEYS